MAYNDREIRQTAESLLHSGSHPVQSPIVDISHSQSINTIPSLHPDYIISEDLLSGQRFQGRMSNIRRFFCLFVTFDLLLTSLMWLICMMLKGENIMKALSEQIYHYNIQTSMFDIVLAAICRFVVLLLFYALCYLNHWIVISLSTALTCIFLIAKVFMYDWPISSQPVFEVLLVLTSFVLSWGEAWFLDFRVLPQESNARRYIITSPDSERAPLIRSYVQGLPSMYTESVGNFYSPLQSPEGSMDRFTVGPVCSKYTAISLSNEQVSRYKNLAAQTLQQAWDLLPRSDWKLDKERAGDTVHTMVLPKTGKIFKLTAIVETPPKFLLDELFYGVSKVAEWNPTLLESQKVQVLDEHTDITYNISADAGGGMVSSRDFVTLRHWKFIDGVYIIATIGTEHPSFPHNNKYVRGENGPGCYAMKAATDNSRRCTFTWILNTDLKGWMPQKVKDAGIIGMMFDYANNLRQHVKHVQETET